MINKILILITTIFVIIYFRVNVKAETFVVDSRKTYESSSNNNENFSVSSDVYWPTEESSTNTYKDNNSSNSIDSEDNEEHTIFTTTNNYFLDWEITETESTIILNKYIGSDINIIIPAEINGKQVIIPSIQGINLPGNIKNLKFLSVNNKQVLVTSNSMFTSFQNNQSIETVDFSGLNMNNVTNMSSMFFGSSNLQSVNFGSNTLPNLETAFQLFFNCINLQTVEGNLLMPKVTNLQSLFGNCRSLQKIDTSQWHTENVTNMTQLFTGCESLVNIDVANWDVSNVNSFYLSFADLPNVHYLDMSKWHLRDDANLVQMFDCTSYSPLFLLTNDNRLLNYNFILDWRIPYGPKLNGNGGKFLENKEEINYFESPAVRPSDPRINTETFKNKWKEFISNNCPKRRNYKMSGWEVQGTTIDNAQDISDLFNTVYSAQWKNINYSTSLDNTILNSTDNFSLAYFPTAFTTFPTPLQNFGKQELPINNIEGLNVGVKDYSLNSHSWEVTAQLFWDVPTMRDTYIQSTNGKVSENISDGIKSYNPLDDLIPSNDKIVGYPNIIINTKSPVLLMKTSSNSIKNGVYDYSLNNTKLIIPDTSNIQIGSYQGYIEWNLRLIPN
ncbi:BspA family leucine-rich repeat surface protein [Enterococcus faecium]|nr:BspA family leucine-rich repeat surface protein [Enterococcus faecium]